MNVKRLSKKGAVKTLEDILSGIQLHIDNNPKDAKILLSYIVTEVLDPLAAEDFFGTEGWKHPFRME